MRTSNPALNAKTFERFGPIAAGEGMTIEGTVNRTGFLLLLLIATATYTWMQTFAGVPIGGVAPRRTRVATSSTRSAGSIGLVTCAWNPASSARL